MRLKKSNNLQFETEGVIYNNLSEYVDVEFYSNYFRQHAYAFLLLLVRQTKIAWMVCLSKKGTRGHNIEVSFCTTAAIILASAW